MSETVWVAIADVVLVLVIVPIALVFAEIAARRRRQADHIRAWARILGLPESSTREQIAKALMGESRRPATALDIHDAAKVASPPFSTVIVRDVPFCVVHVDVVTRWPLGSLDVARQRIEAAVQAMDLSPWVRVEVRVTRGRRRC